MHPLKNWSEIHITKLAITSWPIWWDLVYSWRRQWQLTPILLPGKSHGQRSPLGCSPWGCFESDTTERLHFHFSLSCIGEGNGNPLQCSCLENPKDGGAWWAAVYGVAQSRTRLKRLSSSSKRSKAVAQLGNGKRFSRAKACGKAGGSWGEQGRHGPDDAGVCMPYWGALISVIMCSYSLSLESWAIK